MVLFTSPQLLVIAFKKHMTSRRPQTLREGPQTPTEWKSESVNDQLTNSPNFAGPQTFWHKALSSYCIYSSFALSLWREEYGLHHFRIIWMVCKIRGGRGMIRVRGGWLSWEARYWQGPMRAQACIFTDWPNGNDDGNISDADGDEYLRQKLFQLRAISLKLRYFSLS